MSVKRSKSSRRFVISVFSVVFSAICVSGGDLESPNGYVASIAPDSSFREYGSNLASSRGYSITPSELTYHSSDPVSVPLSQLRDDDGDLTFISSPQTVVETSQVPPLANLVRYIILKEYHVLQDGTMVSANGGTIIRNAAKSASSYSSPSVKSGGGSSSGGYTVSSSSSGYSAPSSSSGGYSSKPSGGYSSSSSGGYSSKPSGGYSSSSSGGYNSKPSGGYTVTTTSSGGGHSAVSGGYSIPTVEIKQIAGLYGPPGKSSIRRPNLPLMNEPEIEITRVELPEDESDEGLINAAVNSVNSGRGGSGGSVGGRINLANTNNYQDESVDGLINAAVNSVNSGRGGSGVSVSGRIIPANNNNDEDEFFEDPENNDDGNDVRNDNKNNQDNVDNEGDDDDNSEDDNNAQDNNDIDDDDADNDGEEDEEETSAPLTSNRNVVGANTRQPNSNRNNNSNRQRNNAVSSSGGSSSANANNNSTFQVTPVRGVTLSSSNNNNNPASGSRNTNRPQSSNNRPRTQNQVLTDAFMFSEPSAEITSVSGPARPLQEQRAQGTQGTTNRTPARINSSNSRGNNSRRNRNRNRSRNNRNRSRANSRRNRNRNRGNSSRSNNSSTTSTSTTTTAAPVSSEEELKPIILPTQASPQLQEALQLVAQFAQQQSELLSRTKQQAKSIAGSVFNSLTIPNLRLGLGTLSGNASFPYPQSSAASPYPQSLAPVPANQVSITTLRESNTTADSDSSSSNQTPGAGVATPSGSEQPPISSSASSVIGTYGNLQILPGFSSSSGISGFQFGQNSSPPPSLSATLATTYGAPSQNLPSLSGLAQGKINHLTNIHQQLAGLKAGFKSGILASVQNTVAAVHSKGETGTTSTTPSTVYGPPTTTAPSTVYGAPTAPSTVYGPPAQNNFQIIKAVKGHFANKGQGVRNHFVNKGSVIRNHFANKGQIVRGHFSNKGSAVKGHFVNKGAAITQTAATLVDAKHMQIQNVIKHIQTIFKHNPALTAW